MAKNKNDNIFKKIKKTFNIKRKYKTYSLFSVFIIGFICMLFGVVFGLLITYGTNTVTGEKISQPLQTFINTYQDIVNNYYDEVDEEELINSAIDGVMDNLDINSQYYTEEAADEFNSELNGYYVGIGVTVSFKDDTNTIIKIAKNSPGEKAGLKVNDKIIKVDNKTIDSSNLTNAVKGEEGTTVKVTVLRNDKEKTFTMKRGKIEIETVTSEIKEQNNKKIGILTLSAFSANTYKQFKKELNKIEKKNIDGLVIDLRNNKGGQLTQTDQILNLFFKKNTVLFKIETKNNIVTFKDTTKEKRTYPISIIVNSSSASASEVLASCFKEQYKNAYIVGNTTYGKGTVQDVKNFSSNTTIKYTTKKWLTSKGKWINEIGIEPDYKVDYTIENYNNGIDPQMDKALELVSK